MSTSQFRIPDGAHFTVEWDEKGQSHKLTGKGRTRLELEKEYEPYDFYHRAIPVKSNMTLTVEGIEKVTLTIKETRVEYTATVEIEKATTAEIDRARKLAGVDKNAEFRVETFNGKAKYVVFRWEE